MKNARAPCLQLCHSGLGCLFSLYVVVVFLGGGGGGVDGDHGFWAVLGRIAI